MRLVVGLIFSAVVTVSALVSAQAQGPISQATAARYGLQRAWFTQVGSPFTNGSLEYVAIADGLLLVQSSRGTISAIDGETGRTLWTTQAGPRDYANSQPVANDKVVVVVSGSTLYVYNRNDGSLNWSCRLKGNPGAGPSVSPTHVFVPMISGVIEGYDLEKGAKQTPWNYKSAGRILVSPMASYTSVIWTTERGHFYVADPSAGGIRYRLETHGIIDTRPAWWTPLIFAASTEGYIFAVNETLGRIVWKHSLGDSILQSPVALDDQLYAVGEYSGLYRLSSKTGDVEWQAPGIKQFVSASPSRVYGADKIGGLAIVDAQTGGRLGTMRLSGISKMLVNDRTDRIYLVSNSCVVQCLHEISLRKPHIYDPPKPPKKETDEKPRRRPRPAAAEEPAEEDPAGIDPALEEPTAEDPAAGEMPAEEAPAEEGTAEEAPAEEMPAEETPAEEPAAPETF